MHTSTLSPPAARPEQHLDPETREFYCRSLTRLGASGVPFLVGGAYARRWTDKLLVGAGIKYDWLFEPGELTFELPTHHGTIVFHGQRSGYRYKINISGTCTAPMVLQLPYFAKSVTVDGRPGTMEIKIDKLPAEVVVDLD